MPTAYQELLLATEPEVVETREQYDAVYQRFGTLFDKGRRGRTPEEEKLYRLLALLIQDYDRRHAFPPDNSTPAERLQYVLDNSGKTPSDLIPIFGQKSHVSEALKGSRPISADHARKLGKLFHLSPGYFI